MRKRTFRESVLWVTVGVILSLGSLSCEKVIDINLNKTNPKYVIEGNLSDLAGECMVLVSKTINISESNDFPGVENAVVSIQQDDRAPVKLIQTSPGVYESGQVKALSLSTYKLSVVIDGEEFTSSVKVPEKVAFDSLYIADFTGFGNTRRFANVAFTDAKGLGNAYRFIQYKNGLLNSNIFVLNDEFSDGRVINTFLAYFDNSENQRLDTGDTVTVEMQGIDPSVYKFFMSLSQSSTGGSESVAPGNPVSNIKGGALGYFNACIKQRRTVIVE